MGEIMNFHDVFTLDGELGKIYWKSPPKNHAEKTGTEAGYLNAGAGKNKSYWQVRVFGKTFKRSRVIFYMANGRWPSPAVDHINGNSLDDRPINLRECTLSQNAVNSATHSRIHALPRGVYLTKQGRYMARLTRNRLTKSLGVYATPEEAKAVYDGARKEAFGEFA